MKAREQFKKAYGISLSRNSHIEITALLVCLEIVLAFSYLGFIQIPPISVTTLSIIVIVAAMFLGPGEAVVVALIFAFTSMWKASLTSVEEGDIIFSPLLSGKPVESIIMAVVTRVLFALAAGLMYRRFFSRERKHRTLGISIIAVVSTALHALLVYICMVSFFGAADAQTSTSFDRTLLLNNLLLYAVTVLVALGCDALMRNATVNSFFRVISSDNVRLTKNQKNISTVLTVAVVLVCIFLSTHFISRIVGYFTQDFGKPDSNYITWTYALLLQLVIGFAATFGIISLFFRWMQEYFSAIAAVSREHEQIREEIVENYNRFFVLEDDFESLYDVEMDSGNYTSYVKGDFYRSNVTDKLVQPTDYFEDLRSNIDAVIYSDDRDGLYSTLTRDAIRRELEGTEHFDYFYRVNTDLGPMWFKMRIVYKNAEKKNVIIGVFDAGEEIAAKERSDRLTAAFANEYELSLLYNLREGSFRIVSTGGGSIDRVSDLLGYDESNSIYAQKYVHPDDRAYFSGDVFSAEGIKARMNVGESFSFEYRHNLDGRYVWYRAVLNRIGDNEVLIGYKNCNEEILSRHLSEKVIADFASVFIVDLNSDTFRFVSRNSESGFNDVPGGIYSETIREYISRVNPAYREHWYNVCDTEKVRELLAGENRLEYVYPLEGVEKRWRRCILQTLESENGVPTSFIMTYFVIDDESAENLELSAKVAEQKSQLEVDMQMIGGLADRYDTLYFVNIAEGIFKVYALDGEKYPGTNNIVSGQTDPFEALRLFGSSPIVHPDDRSLFEELNAEYIMERLAHSKKYSMRYRQADGGDFVWFEMEVVKYEDTDEPANALAIGFTNCDSEIRAEQEYQQQLEDAREAADAANEAKSNFLFNMSHDIRTPMNAIRGFTTMAKKNVADPEKVSGYLDKIDISGQQLLTLINQVLEMARIESGKVTLDENRVSVRDEFNSMVTVLSEQADANGLDFVYSLSNVEHNNVIADEARMSSITLNIAGNAMKYTPEGGRVVFDLREVSPRKPGFATFVFSVEDSGIGMSEDYLKVLYEPFTREKSTTVSKIQGTGLGLSIVKSTIELMGGEIEVRSRLGEGTRFDVTVDFRIDEQAQSAVEEAEAARTVSLAGRRVLLVEDNEMNREIARDILEEQGLIVEDAEDGDVAVEMVKRIAERGDYMYYDFILMDIQMPRMSGYEAARAIREIPGPEDVHIPIIAMTANAFEEDRQNALAAGMDEHLSKPIDVRRMFTTIAKFLGNT